MVLEPAQQQHIDAICRLVNTAYRGGQGWTNESDFVEGKRSNVIDIQGYISNPEAHLLVLQQQNKVVSYICIEIKEDCAYLGLFAVHPSLQGCGLGKKVLSLAEDYAAEKMPIVKYGMLVLAQRIELISYYERRGYRRTGCVEDYPTHLNVGEPRQAGLTVEYLEKQIL